MGFGSIWHWLVILLVVVLLFGAGKLPRAMGDLGRGIRALKEGLKGEGDKQIAEKKEEEK